MKNYKSELIKEEESYKASTVFIIIIIISIILVGFYFLTTVVIKNQNNSNETEAVIKSEMIMFGQMFNKSDNEYYVLAYDTTKQSANLYKQYLKKYNSKSEHLNYYEVDLNSSFNSKYISDKENIVSDLDSLKVSGDTLFKIVDGKIDSFYSGSEKINAHLKEISNN